MNCNVASCIAAAITLAACRSELPPPDVQTVDVQTVDAAMRDVQIAVRDVPPLPDEPPVVHPERPQPAISGGTLLIASDGRIAVAADPDGDVIWFADLETRTRLGSLALQRGDEPGRIVQDASGRVHVVLRGGGAVVSIDPGSRTLIERRAVCAAPRGIAYEPTGDALLVACAGGELVTLPAAGGSATRTVLLGRDLRDVVVQGDRIYVTRFRAAEVITLRSNGDVIERTRPPVFTAPSTPGLSFAPGVAWRTIGLPDGGLLMLHQRSQVERVSTVRGYGGGACGSGIVHSAVTTFGPAGPLRTPVIMATVLPVDLALSPDGRELAIVSAGRGEARSADVQLVPRDQLASGSECARGSVLPADALGRTLAVAWSGNSLIVQTRGPATLRVLLPIAQTIVLDESVAEERGQALFHASTPSGLACASCHPEAGDDGHTWQSPPALDARSRCAAAVFSAPHHFIGAATCRHSLT